MEITSERKQLWLDYINAVRTKNTDLAKKCISELSTMITSKLVNDEQKETNDNDDTK